MGTASEGESGIHPQDGVTYEWVGNHSVDFIAPDDTSLLDEIKKGRLKIGNPQRLGRCEFGIIGLYRCVHLPSPPA